MNPAPACGNPAPACTEGNEGKEGIDVVFLKAHPEYKMLKEHLTFRGVTPSQYASILKSHPNVDRVKAIQKAIDAEALMTGGVKEPALFLKSKFSIIEKDGDHPDSQLPNKGKFRDMYA